MVELLEILLLYGASIPDILFPAWVEAWPAGTFHGSWLFKTKIRIWDLTRDYHTYRPWTPEHYLHPRLSSPEKIP